MLGSAGLITPCRMRSDRPQCKIGENAFFAGRCFLERVKALLMRSNQLNVQSGQLSIQRITIVSLVSNQPDGEISGKPRCESLSYKLDFMRAGRTRVNGDRNTIAVDHCHDLATLAPLGLSHVPAPLLAVTNVPSMKHSVRSSLPRSRRSSANTFGVLSKTPSPAQFRYRRWQVWYGG